MKIFGSVLLLLSLARIALAWTKEDHEIFDLVSALETAEGKGTSFYSFLNVTPTASLDQINKAYRKRSLALHPDKNRNVPDIQTRFARLGVITNILRNSEERARYDHFFKNGIPRWRGTGYYYSRFRPSLLHVLVFLTFLTSVIHYVILYMREKRDQGRVEWFERRARELAFPGLSSGSAGGSGTSTPLPVEKAEVVADVMEQLDTTDTATEAEPKLTRRQARSREGRKEMAKFQTEKEQQTQKVRPAPPAVAETSEKRRKVRVPYVEDGPQGGPVLDLVVNGDGDVLLPGDVSLRSQIRAASYTDLWPVALARSVYSKFTSAATNPDEADEIDADAVMDVVSGTRKSSRKTSKKPRSLAKRGVSGKN